jgi:hypothetical protein
MRTHLRGHDNILKRLVVHSSGFNLGLFMRTRFGIGTPRGLQGRAAAILELLVTLWMHIEGLWQARRPAHDRPRACVHTASRFELLPVRVSEVALNHGQLTKGRVFELLDLEISQISKPSRSRDLCILGSLSLCKSV